jgi:hypothetical protein
MFETGYYQLGSNNVKEGGWQDLNLFGDTG